MWHEYYSIEKGGLTVFFHLLPGLAFFIAGAIILYQSRKVQENRGCTLVFLSAYTGFSLLLTIGIGYDVATHYFRLLHALHNHQYQELEGYVENYDIRTTRQGEVESFTLNGVSFQYGRYGVNPGFNELTVSGGPIVNNQRIKLYAFEGVILKLWVWEE